LLETDVIKTKTGKKFIRIDFQDCLFKQQ